MAWCEGQGVDYVLGLPTNAVLRADPGIVTVADACAVKRAQRQYPVLRTYAETRYGAKSWNCQRRVVARIEASTLGMDIRYVVTSLASGSPEHIYDTLYCARGQAENLIKRIAKATDDPGDHPKPSQLASDRTSCRSANANQMRLILHTAAYWLIWRVQQAIPKDAALACAEFSTLRLPRVALRPPCMRRFPLPSRSSTGALSHILMRCSTFLSRILRATDRRRSECEILSKYPDKSASTKSV